MFLLCLLKSDTQTVKSAVAAKNLFSSVYVIGTTYFNKCSLFLVITGRGYFSKTIIVILSFFSTAMFLCSLKRVIYCECVFYCLISAILIPKLKYHANTKVPEWSSHISNFYIMVFWSTFSFWCTTFSFMNENFLAFWKLLKILKAYFWHKLMFLQIVYSAYKIT